MEKQTNKGSITIPLATASLAITFVSSVLVSYFANQISINDKVNSVDTKAEVTAANVVALTNGFDRLDKKVDILLQHSGVSQGVISSLNK